MQTYDKPKENRTERIGIRATKHVKSFLSEYKKRTDNSPADVLENAAYELEYGDYIGRRLLVIEDELQTLREIIILVDNKIDKLIKEKESLKTSKKGKKVIDNSKEERTIRTVKSYFEILKQHTRESGDIGPDFQKQVVAEKLCSAQNSDLMLFEKIVKHVEKTGIDVNDLSLDYVKKVIV